jgi:hypothetical protein
MVQGIFRDIVAPECFHDALLVEVVRVEVGNIL